jgi:hypothetical protein
VSKTEDIIKLKLQIFCWRTNNKPKIFGYVLDHIKFYKILGLPWEHSKGAKGATVIKTSLRYLSKVVQIKSSDFVRCQPKIYGCALDQLIYYGIFIFKYRNFIS